MLGPGLHCYCLHSPVEDVGCHGDRAVRLDYSLPGSFSVAVSIIRHNQRSICHGQFVAFSFGTSVEGL